MVNIKSVNHQHMAVDSQAVSLTPLPIFYLVHLNYALHYFHWNKKWWPRLVALLPVFLSDISL